MIELNRINDSKNNIEHINEVIDLSLEAKKYLDSFEWCTMIVNGWLAKDYGYMLCIFYFEIVPTPGTGADKYVWIIVGDLPPCYIDIESAQNKLEALETYIFLMDEWSHNVLNDKSVDDCFPINVEPTKKYAEMLLSRTEIIKSDFIPELKSQTP